MTHIESTAKLYLGKYSTAILNYLSGQRALTGNWNSPPDRAKIFNVIPERNIITISDRVKRPCSNSKVWVYQSTKPSLASDIALYAHDFDNIPEFMFQTDNNGMIDVGDELFAPTGMVKYELQYSNVCAILRIESQLGKVGCTVLQVSEFNIEFMNGNVDEAFILSRYF